MIDVGQYYEYAFGSGYARVLNMEPHMILNKILHNRYLTGFEIMPWFIKKTLHHRCLTGFYRKRPIIFLGFSMF